MSKSPSPTKTSTPNLPPPNSIPSLLNPPSPRTHRALRRLQSAHTLGQSNHQPSLISQQHRQVLERTLSPANTPSLPHHTRGRSNSDASNMTPTSSSSRKGPMSGKRPVAADALSLDRLIRDGPPDGDLIGALESMRLKILDQGIKSDSDGMVGKHLISLNKTKLFAVSFAHLCVDYTPQCTSSANRRLPRPHPPGSLSSLLQNSQRHLPYASNGSSLPQTSQRSQSDPTPERNRMEAT